MIFPFVKALWNEFIKKPLQFLRVFNYAQETHQNRSLEDLVDEGRFLSVAFVEMSCTFEKYERFMNAISKRVHAD